MEVKVKVNDKDIEEVILNKEYDSISELFGDDVVTIDDERLTGFLYNRLRDYMNKPLCFINGILCTKIEYDMYNEYKTVKKYKVNIDIHISYDRESPTRVVEVMVEKLK